jgi:hypothetical protein
MFRTLIKHTLWGAAGLMYSFAYDTLPTLLGNFSHVRILTDGDVDELYLISNERMLAYFTFAFLMSVSHDFVLPIQQRNGFFIRNASPRTGKAFSEELAAINFPDNQIPDHLKEQYISIGTRIMNDPVILLGDGETYERVDIEQWLKVHTSSPATGIHLVGAELSLVPNMDKRRETEIFVRDKVRDHVLKQARQTVDGNEQEFEVSIITRP